MLLRMTKAQWDAITDDYKGVWISERTDLPDWEAVREQHMGKRTLLRNGSLHIEGLSFIKRRVAAIRFGKNPIGRSKTDP